MNNFQTFLVAALITFAIIHGHKGRYDKGSFDLLLALLIVVIATLVK